MLARFNRPIVVFTLFVVIFIVHITYIKAFESGALSDYSAHHSFALELLNGKLPVPHFLFHLLISFVYLVFPVSMPVASTVIVSMAYLVSMCLIYRLFGEKSCLHEVRGFPVKAVAAAAIMFVAPIALFAVYDRHFFMGYIACSVYHNPTISVLKPLALLHFLIVSNNMNNESGNRISYALLCAVTILAVLAKPSYILNAVPAVLVFALMKYRSKEKFPYVALAIYFVMPAMLILFLQYLFSYSSEETHSSVIFSPLHLFKKQSPLASDFIFLKLLLSIGFPLSVAVCFIKESIKDTKLVFAWLMTAFGMLQVYLFVETGQRMYHGNFLWSGQIAVFILFVASVALLFKLQKLQGFPKARIKFCWSVFALHSIYGGLWYYFNLIGSRYKW